MMESVAPPPDALPRDPELFVYPEGTVLYRVHDRKYHPNAFNPRVEHTHFLGSRFGGTKDDWYPVLYAAPDPATALLETLLHDGAAFPGKPVRTLLRRDVGRYMFSQVRLNASVTLVSLVGARNMAAVAASPWLVQCDKDSYSISRYWAHWIRAQAKEAQGLIWLSKRDPSRQSLVLFEDRFGARHNVAGRLDHVPVLSPTGLAPIDLSEDFGIEWLNETLRPYETTVLLQDPEPTG
jgi:RES domain